MSMLCFNTLQLSGQCWYKFSSDVTGDVSCLDDVTYVFCDSTWDLENSLTLRDHNSVTKQFLWSVILLVLNESLLGIRQIKVRDQNFWQLTCKQALTFICNVNLNLLLSVSTRVQRDILECIYQLSSGQTVVISGYGVISPWWAEIQWICSTQILLFQMYSHNLTLEGSNSHLQNE